MTELLDVARGTIAQIHNASAHQPQGRPRCAGRIRIGAPLLQREVDERAGLQRLGEQETLQRRASAFPQHGQLLAAFHAFSDDAEVQAAAKIDDRLDDVAIGAIGRQFAYERQIDLYLGQRQILQLS